MDDDTFKDMAKLYPEKVGAIRELRATLSQLKLQDLAVGSDGRNRCLLSPFRSKTGRNQPSNSKFIFGPATWARSLIKPAMGRSVAYLDYEQQEFGIGAALSGDVTMKSAYRSGDPYLTFAKQAGAVPPMATKATHKDIREQFKVCALATQYGMGAKSLAYRLGVPESRADELLALHRRTYPAYWKWSDDTEARGMMGLPLSTVFGWTLRANEDNPRTLRNFPIQANGAEMLRLACCLLTEAGITVCAPVHDAVLIEAGADEIDSVVEEAARLMQLASQVVLGGFTIRTEAKVVRYPERYHDERGKEMWNKVLGLL